jgi:hypothetical protein
MVLTMSLALAGCGENPASPSEVNRASPTRIPVTPAGTTATDLTAIDCATEDPEDLGNLTGAWSGDEGGIYYIRHVGDCVWWFGTEIDVIEPGVTGQPGFANVASGRMVGNRIDLEWADLPIGNVLGGGGLTLVYDEENDQLLVVEQRGDWIEFGASTFTRIEPAPDAAASPSASPGS